MKYLMLVPLMALNVFFYFLPFILAYGAIKALFM